MNYNFKSSKYNKLASLFKKKLEMLQLLLETAYPAQIVRPHTCCNLLFNGKNKLIKDILKALTIYNNTLTFKSAVLQVFTSNFAFTLGLTNLYIDVNLKKATRLAIKLFI